MCATASDLLWLGPHDGAAPAGGDFTEAGNWVATVGGWSTVPGASDRALHAAAGDGSIYTVTSNASHQIASLQVATYVGNPDNVIYDFNGNSLTMSDTLGL